MGASISFDSKYRLILDTEVECVSLNPPSDAPKKKQSGGGGGDRKKNDRESESSGSESGSGSGSESGSDSGSDSESETNKSYTVKLTTEIASYIRSYLRKTQFLDEFDLVTEIELDNYNHAPGSALVFNSDSLVFNANNQTIESLGDWEYLPPDHQEAADTKSKSKSKSKSKKRRGDDSDGDDAADADNSKYKTKDDDLHVSEIEHILKEKFEEYNKTREFIIHESKNSFLCLKINSVEIVKA
jgi:hypothetical protein